MVLLMIYLFVETIIDKHFLNGNFRDRIVISFGLQFMNSGLSLYLGGILMMLFLRLVEFLGISAVYINYLISITNGELSEVGGTALLQMVLSICLLSLILYSLIYSISKKHLAKIGILNEYKLKRIQGLSVNGHLSKIYTILIFWFGFVPLLAEIIGNQNYKIDVGVFGVVTLGLAIPYSHINLVKIWKNDF